MSNVAPALSRMKDSVFGRRHRIAEHVLLFAVLCVAAVVLAPTDYVMRICTMTILYAALAMGLNVVVGYAGLLDLGFIAFFGVGAYTYGLLASPLHDHHLNFWLMIPAGMAAAGILGLLVGLPALRTHGDYLAIVTIGFGEIVYTLLVNLDRPVNITNGPQGVIAIDQPRIGGFVIGGRDLYFGPFGLSPTTQFFVLVAVYTLIVMFCCFRLQSARIGRAWRAMRESEAAASSSGISIVRAKLSAFVFGAMVAGGAGVIAAAWYGAIFPDSFVFTESVNLLAMVVLGGLGSVWGALLGAAVLVLVPELLRGFDQYRLLVFGIVLVLMMRFRPQGLISSESSRRASSVRRWTRVRRSRS